jgi:hypothetical protein
MNRSTSSFGQSDKAARNASSAAAARSGDQRLGLVVQRSQELAFPAVPDAWTDGTNIGDGQHEQEFQALGALNDVGEVAYRLRIAYVAAERDLAHRQVLLDQPG